MQPGEGSGRTRAYEHLRTSLLSDPAMVGTFINEQQVAAQVGVSRTPVREALLLLAAEGLVQLLPNRGAFVPPLSPDEVRQILDARGVIETWAVNQALAAGRNPVAGMAERLAAQEELLTSGDNADFIQIDREFHAILVEAGGNPVMTRMYETLRTRHVPIGVAALERNQSGRRAEVIAEHQAIVEALRAEDADAAVAATLAHLAQTRRNLVGG